MKKTKRLDRSKAGFWVSRLVRRSSLGLAVRITHQKRLVEFNTRETSPAAAAQVAAQIWLSLQSNGWEATLARFKQDGRRGPRPAGAGAMVGDVIAALELAVAGGAVREATGTAYAQALRRIASAVGKVDGAGKHVDGARGWRGRVEALPLALLSDEAIENWRRDYLRSGPADRAPQRQRTTASAIRNAKECFQPEFLKHLRLAGELPQPLPFAGVNPGDLAPKKYTSVIDAKEMLRAGEEELKPTRPAEWAILLLGLMAGMRRGEIDSLTWSMIDWTPPSMLVAGKIVQHAAVLRLRGALKTPGSERNIPLSEFAARELAALRERNLDAIFVVPTPPKATGGTRGHSRAESYYLAFYPWLKEHGAASERPLHELRKEAGSLILHKHGLHAASVFLGHRNIQTTAAMYADSRSVVAVTLGL